MEQDNIQAKCGTYYKIAITFSYVVKNSFPRNNVPLNNWSKEVINDPNDLSDIYKVQ